MGFSIYYKIGGHATYKQVTVEGIEENQPPFYDMTIESQPAKAYLYLLRLLLIVGYFYLCDRYEFRFFVFCKFYEFSALEMYRTANEYIFGTYAWPILCRI